ncbi:DUF1760-domain-containing protein [Venturia nashicola]|uniref:DUF1760-domain-containing protein n=1 Tax=Venturia nashicola TaxID=86259 RepID=A0A4Z1NTY4_9PEZI|nr:DUF1760-domain-containing protein [Venturia nashicola]
MTTEDENPWIALKPPVSDAMTYLTFVEHNLTTETLPQLLQVLQDQELNQSIGWDLVQPLVSLVPESEKCLLAIARLGNPREVVLKVSESLTLLELDELSDNDESDDEEVIKNDLRTLDLGGSSKAGAVQGLGLTAEPESSEADLPLPVLQFRVMLSMLSILHPRIKTKFPSRFLSTTLQAVLAAYGKARRNQDDLTYDVVKFVNTLTGTKRPHLPPRKSSTNILQANLHGAVADPEGQAENPSEEEKDMQKRLLQSFLTHILEDYMLSLPSVEDVPGMAWSSRFQEKLNPQRTVLGKESYVSRFEKDDRLKSRLATVGSISALSKDLDLDSHDIFATIMDPSPELTGLESNEDDPPMSPKDIPLSKSGALFLLAARKAVETLYDKASDTPPMSIFPEHATVLQNFIGNAAQNTSGLEPEALIDTVLFLGLIALENNDVGEPQSDDDFNHYLQNASLLSANTPSPSLRYHAHFITSTVLRSHPHDLVRLSFIKDTLEHCPYENLKASAVGWVKGETIEANPPNPAPSESDDGTSIFATPIALQTLAPFLFPDLSDSRLIQPALGEGYAQFKADLSFYLASLNFLWLLLVAEHLHDPLDIQSLYKNGGIEGHFLGPVRQAVGNYSQGLKDGGELWDGEQDVSGEADLRIVNDVLARIDDMVKKLKWS